MAMRLQWMGVSNLLSTAFTHSSRTHCGVCAIIATCRVNMRAQAATLWRKHDDRTQSCVHFQGSFRVFAARHAHGNPMINACMCTFRSITPDNSRQRWMFICTRLFHTIGYAGQHTIPLFFSAPEHCFLLHRRIDYQFFCRRRR